MHFLRDLRGHVRRDQHDALGAIIRQIFTAADGDEARRRLRDAVEQLERRLPKVAALLEEAEADVLAFYAFPAEHWPKLRSTNPLERFNREIGRRTDVVGIFPDDASLIRLVSMLAIEANDEWLVGRSYISQKSMATLWDPAGEGSLSRSRQGGRAHRGLSRQRTHRRGERELSHHVPGLDSVGIRANFRCECLIECLNPLARAPRTGLSASDSPCCGPGEVPSTAGLASMLPAPAPVLVSCGGH